MSYDKKGNNQLLFTVVIPTFNRFKQLEKTLKTVFDQTFQDFEILVVDDGSDMSILGQIRDLLESHAGSTQLISRPDTRQKGANACRNIGMEMARGEYICLLDSDDQWSPNRLSNLQRFLRDNTDAAGIYSGCILNNGLEEKQLSSRPVDTAETTIDFLFSTDGFAQTSTFVISREVVGKVEFEESLLRHQDFEFFIAFQKEVGWTFFENFDVILNWQRGRKKTPHFPSMMKFYNRHKNDIRNKSAEYDYLWHCWIDAYEQRDKEYKKIYLKLLRSLKVYTSRRNRIKLYFPSLVQKTWELINS